MRQIRAVLCALDGADFDETSAEGAHSVGEVIAGAADCKPCCVFLTAALDRFVKR